MFITLSVIFIIAFPIISAEADKSSDRCRNVKYQSLCYSLAAQSEQDESICENINDNALKENCVKSASSVYEEYVIIAALVISIMIILAIIVIILRKRLIKIRNRKINLAKNFVADSRSKGYSNEVIRSHLIKNKIPTDIINKVLSKR